MTDFIPTWVKWTGLFSLVISIPLNTAIGSNSSLAFAMIGTLAVLPYVRIMLVD